MSEDKKWHTETCGTCGWAFDGVPDMVDGWILCREAQNARDLTGYFPGLPGTSLACPKWIGREP